MIKPKKSTIIAGAAVAIALSIAGAGVINAQTASTTGTNPMSALVSAIATKFNLNTADVQSVVDSTMQAQHAQMDAQRQQKIESNLSAAVTAGKLTQAQADLIKAKMTELKTQMEADRTANQSLTPEQMKTKMEAQRTALETWATQNNIPKEFIRFIGGGRGMGGRGMHGHFMKPTNTTSSTTTTQ